MSDPVERLCFSALHPGMARRPVSAEDVESLCNAAILLYLDAAEDVRLEIVRAAEGMRAAILEEFPLLATHGHLAPKDPTR